MSHSTTRASSERQRTLLTRKERLKSSLSLRFFPGSLYTVLGCLVAMGQPRSPERLSSSHITEKQKESLSACGKGMLHQLPQLTHWDGYMHVQKRLQGLHLKEQLVKAWAVLLLRTEDWGSQQPGAQTPKQTTWVFLSQDHLSKRSCVCVCVGQRFQALTTQIHSRTTKSKRSSS